MEIKRMDPRALETLEGLGLAPDEMSRALHRASESFSSEDRSFDCRKCGRHFTPQKGQWIFHNLCDWCFEEFDRQKMRGRIARIFEGKEIPYFESCDE